MFFLLRKTFTILGIVFLIAGFGMAVFVGAYLVNDYDKVLNGARAEAVVLQARDGGKPILEFRTGRGERVRIEGKISSSPSPYKVGERVGVFYDAADPSEALIDTFIERWFVPLLFGGFGTIFLAVGGTLFGLARRSGRRMARLMREGQRLEGRIAGFAEDRYTKINGRHPWRVLVDWTDAKGVMHRSRSEMMREDPSQRFKPGDRVTVLADANDPNVFWIDLFGQSTPAAGIAAPSATSFGGKKATSFGKNTGNTPVIRR